MKGSHLFDELSKASSLDLFRLYAFIERMLVDPKRIEAVRQHLSLGLIIRFFDADRGTMQSGRIVAMSERQVKVQAAGALGVRKLPYAAVQLVDAPLKNAEVEMPAPATARRSDFRRGDRVAFDDRYMQAHFGVILRINSRTATVEGDDVTWRVPYELLRLVIDA